MYIVYKVTNTLNDKYYIGVHKTSNIDDLYMGSGVAIKAAIKKHGIDKFIKEILYITETRDDAMNKEKELTFDYVSNQTYNMKLGRVGGFTKENSIKGRRKAELLYGSSGIGSKGGRASVEQKKGVHSLTKEQLSENGRKGGLQLKNKPKTEAHKQALRDAWAKKNR